MAATETDDIDDRYIHANEVDKNNNNQNLSGMNRKEKRKMLKKMKRKQLRKEIAIKEKEEEEARLNDPEEKMRLLRLEQEEIERMERDRLEFEEREKQFLQELELKKKRQQEEEEEQLRRKLDEGSPSKLDHIENSNELNDSDEWEYVEDGPAEIIWKGNEIIVKKNKIRVPKKHVNQHNEKQESERPISNPLAPQSEAFEDHKSAQEVLDSVAQQVPNFGTEQDKAHCPFHLKTGACRFGARCSRVHFYPDKSCTLLMKNMYNGPGLAWEQDEGLEYTDEEVERSFEDFYEDVHTEFLKFGEIVNFKVCKNASSHLRGNVYVHYKLLESAVLAFQSINGRYFAGKQISCEFINLTKWKVAICGEYMKSRLKTCSRGSACNFIHCFQNPGEDYEWANWDKPAPRYWLKKMAALFGCTSDRHADEVSPGGYRSRRSRSRGSDGGNWSDKDGYRKRGGLQKHRVDNRRTSYFDEVMHEEKRNSQGNHHVKHRNNEDVEMSDDGSDDRKFLTCTMRSSRKRERDPGLKGQGSEHRRHKSYPDKYESSKKGESDRYQKQESTSGRRKRMAECIHDQHQGNGKDNDLDTRESRHRERHHDKHSRRKSKHSLPRKKADSLDNDSLRYGHDRGEDLCHRHSEKISRKEKCDAELSDNGSHEGSVDRNEKKSHKNKVKISRNKSELADDSNRDRYDREEGYHGYGRRSSRHHSKIKLTKTDSNASRCSVDGDKLNNKDEEDLCSYRTHGRHRNSLADTGRSLSKDEIGDTHERPSFRNGLDNPIDSDSQQEILSGYDGGETSNELCNDGQESERHHKSYDIEPKGQMHESNQKMAAPASHDEAGNMHGSSQEIYRQSEAEREQAYRAAALMKLEMMRKSKDSPGEKREHIDLNENHCHDNVLKSSVVDKDMEEPFSSKIEGDTASLKRRRI